MDDALPDPTLTLTLPSIHDGTPLDCRIYLPPSILAVATDPAHAPSLSSQPRQPRWRGNAAIVAHPYAPMGGSQNDTIVRMVAQTLLLSPSSFVVATFNFRGAGRKPQGRTSWTAKPETGDYMTIAGFLYYFAHYLDPYGEKTSAATAPTSAPIPTTTPPPTLLFAGYSYGAMVTSLLPPLATILAAFARPAMRSPAAEVRLRAARWAAIQNADFSAAASATTRNSSSSPAVSPTKARRGEARLSMGIRVGGGPDEDGHWRRKSHEVGGGSMRHILTSPVSPRRSLSGDHRHGRSSSHGTGNGHANSHARSHSNGDNHDEDGRHGVSGLLAKVRHAKDEAEDKHGDDKAGMDGDEKTMAAVPNLTVVRPAYLLVSPPVGLATNLATMSFGAAASATSGFFKRKRTPTSTPTPPADDSADLAHGDGKVNVAAASERATQQPPTLPDETDKTDKLACNPTLVVYGDADGFVSLKKMRTWAAGLTATSSVVTRALPGARQPLFRALEIPKAGHFWIEGRTCYELEEAVHRFAADLGGDQPKEEKK